VAALPLTFAFSGCQTERVGPRAETRREQSQPRMEKELKKLQDAAEAADKEVQQLIQANQKLASAGGGVPRKELYRRIEARFLPVRQGYEKFLRRHPKHVEARTAYATFLGEHQDEDGSREQFEKALAVEQNDPNIYNSLANIYGHSGSVKKAFEFYAKAIELDPTEPVYYNNFGTTVYLFRKDAKEFYEINEQQVFDKALALYSNSMRLDPTNFALASDVALSYYGIKPWRFEDALLSWTNALRIAPDEAERQGVYLHFARIKIQAGRFEEARNHLDAVTNEKHAQLKNRLMRNLAEREKQAAETNAPSASPTKSTKSD
jgi:Flp pilus assembly protein TadD